MVGFNEQHKDYTDDSENAEALLLCENVLCNALFQYTKLPQNPDTYNTDISTCTTFALCEKLLALYHEVRQLRIDVDKLNKKGKG